ATLVGDVFDDAATGQGLLNYVLRAMNCGAITEEEAVEKSALTAAELRGRSFVKILKSRGKSCTGSKTDGQGSGERGERLRRFPQHRHDVALDAPAPDRDA